MMYRPDHLGRPDPSRLPGREVLFRTVLSRCSGNWNGSGVLAGDWGSEEPVDSPSDSLMSMGSPGLP